MAFSQNIDLVIGGQWSEAFPKKSHTFLHPDGESKLSNLRVGAIRGSFSNNKNPLFPYFFPLMNSWLGGQTWLLQQSSLPREGWTRPFPLERSGFPSYFLIFFSILTWGGGALRQSYKGIKYHLISVWIKGQGESRGKRRISQQSNWKLNSDFASKWIILPTEFGERWHWPLLLHKSHFQGPFQSDLVFFLLVSFCLDICVKIGYWQQLLL